MSKFYVGDKLDVATYTPRVAVALRLAVPLFDHVWLDGLASFSLAPFGHGDFAPGPGDPPLNVPPKDVTLPGEPAAALQLGVGLRMGAP